MVKPSRFNAPETDAVYPLGHLIGNFEINQELLNFEHQVDMLTCCALFAEVGIPQFEAQSASCATSARAEVAKRFNKLFLAIAQVAQRFKENKSFLRFIALRTEKIHNSVRIIALRTEKNLVACALLRCALSEVEILRCALSD